MRILSDGRVLTSGAGLLLPFRLAHHVSDIDCADDVFKCFGFQRIKSEPFGFPRNSADWNLTFGHSQLPLRSKVIEALEVEETRLR